MSVARGTIKARWDKRPTRHLPDADLPDADLPDADLPDAGKKRGTVYGKKQRKTKYRTDPSTEGD